MKPLETRLLAAHAAADRATLVGLYEEAGFGATTDTARGFYLTQAYVYALDTGHPNSGVLHARLKQLGREE